MSNDFYINPATGDWDVKDGTTVALCETVEDLTRQRIAITLRTFQGEWFANSEFGLPYFQSIYGKGTKATTDVVIKDTIAAVEGVQKVLFYKSTLDAKTRKLSVEFKALTESGEIIEEDIDL